MLKHHKLDTLLVLIACLQVFILLLPFFSPISSGYVALLLLLNVLLIGTNYQCVAHNFIHHPFFKFRSINSIFSVLNTLCLGIPQSLYRIHHLEHHRHNNRPDTDETSTFRYGKDGKEEDIFSYSIKGLFRTDLVRLYTVALSQSTLVRTELVVLAVFLGTLLFLNWKLLLFYVIGSYILGQVFALWENYCEHHHADPSDRKRDSVSCYNPLYNFIWFNNGYHQEHHFSPQTHWTQIRMVKAKLPEDRKIVKGCHLLNSF